MKEQTTLKDNEDYIDVLAESDLPERKPVSVSFGGKDICLVKVDGEYFAFSNVCTHIGARLSEGTISTSKHIACPIHHAVYDIKDGRSLSFPRRGIVTYDTKVEAGRIKLRKMPNKELWREDFQSSLKEKLYWKSSSKVER